MFISDVAESNKEELHDVIIYDLRHLGVKHRVKKSANKQHSQHIKHGNTETTKVFRVPLHHLDHEAVLLNCGAVVEVPCFVTRACSLIKQHIGTEGIFRKAGSSSRQKELKASLDCGKKFGPEHHVVDVANLLKMFFRELPEPLIPHVYQDVLLRCLLLQDKKIEGMLLTCLLIPAAHINTLAYLMQFLQEVASHSDKNKMDVKNLAIIIAPSVMPVEERIVVSGTSRLSHHVQVIELLISNADKIGNLPENVYEKLVAANSSAPLSNDEQDGDLSRQSKKKKKRRSGSITRVLNGLKKMVGKGTPEVDENHLITSTPDFSTPYVKSGKKRKASEGASAFSSKKKRDVLEILPQSVALANIPYTPSRSMAHDFYISSPVCSHPNPSRKSKSPQSAKHRHRRFFTSKSHTESEISKINKKETHSSCKQTQQGVGSWSGKKQKPEELALVCHPFGSDISCHLHHESRGSSPERSWSEGPWGRKKHLNLSDIPVFSPSDGAGVDITSDGELAQIENPHNTFIQEAQTSWSDSVIHVQEPHHAEEEFVRIPKSEYEAIKNRVSAIENRISQEFGNMISTSDTDSSVPPQLTVPSSNEVSSNAESVQTAYEMTLVESEKLGEASADHLARRLNRELRIRRSLEGKVVRSPSARKIGTIRRRSKENARPVFKTSEMKEVARNMSWHLAVRPNLSQISHFCPRSNLKRGRPNTVYTGLPQPSPRNTVNMENKKMTVKYLHDISSENKNEETLQNCKSSLLDNDINMTDLAQYLDLCMASDGPITRSKARRASSFHGSEWAYRNEGFRSDSLTSIMKSSSHHDIPEIAIHNSPSLDSNANVHRAEREENKDWKTADVFFSNDQRIVEETPVTGRASVAKLRTQNAGMVLERMKLFDSKANCSLSHHEKEKSMIDSKGKRAVHVPSVFACYADVSQSLRMQCSRSTPTKKQNIFSSNHSKSASKVHSPLVPKSWVGDMLDTFKDSPKKIGTPRRKHRMKSPNSSHQKQKLKLMKSPSRIDPTSVDCPASTVHRKHSSMKLAHDRVCTKVKANLTVPINLLSTEKENVLSPDHTSLQPNLSSQSGKDLREEPQFQHSCQASVSDTFKEMCSPAVCKTSVSPLKDCNRIEVSSQIPHLCSKDPSVITSSGYRTPRETPYIKQALFSKSPSQFCKTPQSSLLSSRRSGHCYPTPMKAVADLGSGTPVGSLRRQSPRIMALKSRNIP